MAVLISAFKISKSFGSQNLFKNLSFAIESGQRIGLIGPNGAGKSTLLQILSKFQSPDQGELSFANNLRIGYLNQNPVFKENKTVFMTIAETNEDAYDPDNLSLTQELISKLNLENPEAVSDRLVNELSGGWRKRVALACELVKRPNLLLLDEPTNHLDLPSILWLEEFLQKSADLAVLTVTHDRLFLQNTSELIFDLDRRNVDGLIKFKGSYAEFLTFKEAQMDAQKNLEATKKNTLRRETEWLRRGAKARQTKQKARIERAGELSQEVSEISERNLDRRVQIDFGDNERSPKKMIEVKNISKKIGDRYLFNNLSILVGPKSRIGLLGPNGCGKSTLIRTLLGLQEPDSGSVFIAEQVGISYFEQQKESLDPNISLLKSVCPEGDYVHLQGQAIFARSYLAKFHFRADQMDLPVGKLSGGEQSRVLIAKLMLNSESILVLDEPTNDLDIATLDVLQDALMQFNGAVILVTHDRYFMDQVANQIYAFTDNEGELLKFADFFQWQEWYDTKKSNKNKSTPTKSASTEIAPEPSKTAKNRLSYKEQRELDQMEDVISKEETKASDIEQQLTLKENLTNHTKLSELSHELEKQKAKINKLYARWEELQAKN